MTQSQDCPRCSGWMPIETAPKDREFLGGYFNQPWPESHREGRVVKCWWQSEFEAFISSCRQHTLRTGFTFDDGSQSRLHSPVIEQVTHWLDIPPPPGA